MTERVAILTDSLGCPRPGLPAEQTWVDRCISALGRDGRNVYPICRHGLTASEMDFDYLHEIEPDFLIVQVGIVDACRRVYSLGFKKILDVLPMLIASPFRLVGSKMHHQITRWTDTHYATLDEYEAAMRQLAGIPRNGALFIGIAPPGPYLAKRTSHVTEDVERYNKGLREVVSATEGARYLDPYSDDAFSEELHLMDDGHHLTPSGNALIYDRVMETLGEMGVAPSQPKASL